MARKLTDAEKIAAKVRKLQNVADECLDGAIDNAKNAPLHQQADIFAKISIAASLQVLTLTAGHDDTQEQGTEQEPAPTESDDTGK